MSGRVKGQTGKSLPKVAGLEITRWNFRDDDHRYVRRKSIVSRPAPRCAQGGEVRVKVHLGPGRHVTVRLSPVRKGTDRTSVDNINPAIHNVVNILVGSVGTLRRVLVSACEALGARRCFRDLGQGVGGAGSRRITIANNGDVEFTGTVRAPAFVPTSSQRFKENLETIRDADELVRRLRGVSFNWKETGKPSVGLIAEEVAKVIPEVVDRTDDGQVAGANYSALVGVLVEAYQAQEQQMETLKARLDETETLMKKVLDMKQVKAELTEIRSLLRRTGSTPETPLSE